MAWPKAALDSLCSLGRPGTPGDSLGLAAHVLEF